MASVIPVKNAVASRIRTPFNKNLTIAFFIYLSSLIIFLVLNTNNIMSIKLAVVIIFFLI